MTDDRAALLAELVRLRTDLIAAEDDFAAVVAGVHPSNRPSSRNLIHYLALRTHDLRPLQDRLARQGLSSLGRAEAHVLATIDAVIRTLAEASGAPAPDLPHAELDFVRGDGLLEEHTAKLFGPEPARRRARIMVTLPTEAADDPTLVLELVRAGMDCMRINCAHDDIPAWERMIDYLRRAESLTGRSCRILMDLGGPKIRTGPVTPGPAVLRLKPVRDVLGRVISPARIRLAGSGPGIIPVPADWLGGLSVGDRIRLVDARGARRRWVVTCLTADGAVVECSRTTYVVPGIQLRRPDGARAGVGELPPSEGAIPLDVGDLLVLLRDGKPGRPARTDAEGRTILPAATGCIPPGVVGALRVGERVWLDDGRIGTVVERIDAEGAHLRVTRCRVGGVALRGGRGINLPETALSLPGLSDRDLALLSFVLRHADMVGLSFANSPGDVLALEHRLAASGDRAPALVLKVETRRGFEQLPALMLAAMRAPRWGVMIARGDLAVECGFERLAEVQEEILWLCEAAHVPAIWATQVLESLAKEGLPSRAEITDAAMGNRAECVMLNKGPHVVRAVGALDDILHRMQAHSTKKRSMLRQLALARAFMESARGSARSPAEAGDEEPALSVATERTSAV